MKKLSRIAIIFCFLFLFSACGRLEVVPGVEKKYFDIPGFFKEEFKRLNEQGKPIKKKIIKDSVTEEKIVRDPQWEKELAAFIQIDINKPAFINAYRADTIDSNGNSYEIRYTAIEETPVIRFISLIFENNACTFVRVEKDNPNKLFRSIQELQYDTKKGYNITGKLNIRYFYQIHYKIKTEFF